MRLRIALVCGWLAAGPAVGQAASAGDPVPDRYLLLTSARTLPADSTHVAVLATLTSGIVSHGIVDRVTLTVGSPAWTVFTGVAIVGWNAKLGLVQRREIAVAVGDVGLAAARLEGGNDDLEAVHWPYVALTGRTGRFEGTVNVGIGLGRSDEISLLGRAIVQGALAADLGARARLFVEHTALRDERGITSFGVRLWDDRYFLDMGGVINLWEPRLLPWFGIGGRF